MPAVIAIPSSSAAPFGVTAENGDFVLTDATGNSGAGRIIARISPESAATNGTATKWRIGRGSDLTTLRDSTAMAEVRGLDVDLTVLRVRAQDLQVGPMQEWQDGSGNTELQVTGDGDLKFGEGLNLIAGTIVGTMIGSVGGAAGEMLGFWGAFPIVQPVLATGAGKTVDNVISTLQLLGLCRQS